MDGNGRLLTWARYSWLRVWTAQEVAINAIKGRSAECTDKRWYQTRPMPQLGPCSPFAHVPAPYLDFLGKPVMKGCVQDQLPVTVMRVALRRRHSDRS